MEKSLDFKPKMISAIKQYDRKTFMADLMAGVIVGIVAFGESASVLRIASTALIVAGIVGLKLASK